MAVTRQTHFCISFRRMQHRHEENVSCLTLYCHKTLGTYDRVDGILRRLYTPATGIHSAVGRDVALLRISPRRSAILGASAQIERAAWIVQTQQAGSPGVNLIHVTKRPPGQTIEGQEPEVIGS